MAQCWKFKQRLLVLISGLAIPGLNLFPMNRALTQVVPDRTLGAESSIVTPKSGSGNVMILGGATRGTNLFHSFSQFSVPTKGTAYFNNALSIQNIIARITGGSASNIDGLIKANGTANLFLINPNGIVFGPNAALNVGGSFVASTASSLKFGDGTEFSATNPQTSPLLTVSVPIGLQFGANPGSILNQSQATDTRGNIVGLQVLSGQTLALVGGDVNLDRGRLNALGGRVELGGLAGAGTVGLAINGNTFSLGFPPNSLLSNVSLANGARVRVRGSGGGNIVVNANTFTATGGGLLAVGTEGSGNGGDITVNANDFSISGVGASDGVSSGLYNQIITNASGNAGNIFVNTRAFDASSGALVSNTVTSGAIGNGGNVNIKTDSLSVTKGAGIGSFTFGHGNAGNVTITASGHISFDGVKSGAFSEVDSGAIGKGGNVNVTAGSLSVTNGAQISTRTSGQGDAGSVTINTSSLASFDSANNVLSTGAFSEVLQGAGKGGNVNVTASSLSVTNGAEISTRTDGNGDAGSVIINTSSLASFDGDFSGAFSTVGYRAIGKGGNVNVTVGSLSVTNEAQLSTNTDGNRDAGNVNVTAGSLSVTNGAQLSTNTDGNGDAGSVTINTKGLASFDGNSGVSFSGAFSQVELEAMGKGGNVNVTAGSLSVTNGAQISASTFGNGDAGSVTINTRGLASFDGRDNVLPGGVFSEVYQGAIGKGGNVNITAGSLSVTNGSQLSASTNGNGDAGNITINTRGLASFNGVGSIGVRSGALSTVESGAMGKGGNVNVTAGSLSVTNGAALSANTFGQGNGGNVNVTAGSLSVTNGAVLSAGTNGNGDAGNVTINTSGLASFDGSSSGASSQVLQRAMGKGGNVNVTAGSLSVTNGAQISTGTFGQGDAGNVTINTQDRASFDGTYGVSASGAFSEVNPGAMGKGGNVNVTAGSLSVTNGSEISASTFGQGDAGSVTINIRGLASFDGVLSGAFSEVNPGAKGKGGDVNVTAGSLSVTNGAVLAATTFGQGDAGNITINTRGLASFNGVGSNTQSSGAFSTVESGAKGKGGDVNVTAGSLSVTNGSMLTSSSHGSGNAGNLEVIAGSIRLDNKAALRANTVTGQGNINLHSGDLILRRGSDISTNATGTSPGGNITINTDNLVAVSRENSDIRANATESFGGRVSINAQGIFGIQFQQKDTPLSDITATSALGPQFSGVVNINTPNVNPGNGLETLPAVVVDPSRLVAQGCGAGEGTTNSQFTVTGRGGLPPSPGEVLSRNAVLADTRLPTTTVHPKSTASSVTAASSSAIGTLPAPATGVIFDSKGQATLIAEAPTTRLEIPWLAPHTCR